MELSIFKQFKGHWNYSILDQMLFSATGIISTIICARILGAEIFGIWAIFMLLSLLQSDINRALIIQPMMRHATSISPRIYLGTPFQLAITLILLGSIIASLICAIIVHISSERITPNLNLILLLVVFFIVRSLLDMARGVFQAYEKGRLLLFIDTVHSFALFFLLFYFQARIVENTDLSTESLFLVIAIYIVSSLTAIISFIKMSNKYLLNTKRVSSTNFSPKSLIKTHIDFGGWLALANGVKWFGSNTILLASAYFLTSNETGLIRAAISIFGPIGIAFQLADNLLFVRISAFQSASNRSGANRLFAFGAVSLPIITASIVAAITLTQQHWLVPLFGESFKDVAKLLPMISIAYISLSIVLIAQIKLRLHNETKALFGINLAIAVITMLLMPLYFEIFAVNAFAVGVIVNNLLLLLLVKGILWKKNATSLPHHTYL